MGMKELLTASLETIYDPDLAVSKGQGHSPALSGSSAGGYPRSPGPMEDEEDGMEWLSGHQSTSEKDHSTISPPRDDSFLGSGLGLGLGIGLTNGQDQGISTEEAKVAEQELRDSMRQEQAQDLTFMWRSKLYADVRIKIANPSPPPDAQAAAKAAKVPPSSFRQTPVIRRATSFSSVKDTSANNGSSNRPGSALSLNLDMDQDLGFDLDEETGEITFSAHRFMLCSRSPYFAQVLLNAGQFQPHASSAHRLSAPSTQSLALIPAIALPTPPFTPQATHFVLGYIYSGTLSKFSNKQLDMPTALLVRKCATYLEMDALEKEVEARLVWEFSHGIAWDDRTEGASTGGAGGIMTRGKMPINMGCKARACRCRKCVKRIPRLLRFATSPDVNSGPLIHLSKEYVIRGWSECLGKDIALLEDHVRDQVIDEIMEQVAPTNIVSTVQGLLTCRQRLEKEGKATDEWVDEVEDILDMIAERAVQVMANHPRDVLACDEIKHVVGSMMGQVEVLEAVLGLLIEGVGRVNYCKSAPRVYEVGVCPEFGWWTL